MPSSSDCAVPVEVSQRLSAYLVDGLGLHKSPPRGAEGSNLLSLPIDVLQRIIVGSGTATAAASCSALLACWREAQTCVVLAANWLLKKHGTASAARHVPAFCQNSLLLADLAPPQHGPVIRDLLRQLLQRGAELELHDTVLLMAAARAGHLEVLQEVFEPACGRPREPSAFALSRALTAAAEAGQRGAVLELLRRGAPAAAYQSAALVAAARRGDAELCRRLCAAGADPTADSSAALRQAVRGGFASAAAALLQAGADPRALCSAALLHACELGAVDESDRAWRGLHHGSRPSGPAATAAARSPRAAAPECGVSPCTTYTTCTTSWARPGPGPAASLPTGVGAQGLAVSAASALSGPPTVQTLELGGCSAQPPTVGSGYGNGTGNGYSHIGVGLDSARCSSSVAGTDPSGWASAWASVGSGPHALGTMDALSTHLTLSTVVGTLEPSTGASRGGASAAPRVPSGTSARSPLAPSHPPPYAKTPASSTPPPPRHASDARASLGSPASASASSAAAAAAAGASAAASSQREAALVALVELLLAAGADARAHGRPALEAAAARGHRGVVRALLRAGADPAACNSAALVAASIQGHDQVVAMLLDSGADPLDVSDFALGTASERGFEAVVQRLRAAQSLSMGCASLGTGSGGGGGASNGLSGALAAPYGGGSNGGGGSCGGGAGGPRPGPGLAVLRSRSSLGRVVWSGLSPVGSGGSVGSVGTVGSVRSRLGVVDLAALRADLEAATRSFAPEEAALLPKW